jgi:hypothetical protein
MAGGTEAFHPNDYSKASLGRHSKCNTKTKSQTLWGRKNQNLASNAPVCVKDLDTADFLIDGLQHAAPAGAASFWRSAVFRWRQLSRWL